MMSKWRHKEMLLLPALLIILSDCGTTLLKDTLKLSKVTQDLLDLYPSQVMASYCSLDLMIRCLKFSRQEISNLCSPFRRIITGLDPVNFLQKQDLLHLDLKIEQLSSGILPRDK